MKALSVKQPWATRIAYEGKTIETRTWPTDYRGPLLIVSSKRPVMGPAYPVGMALCKVGLVACHRMVPADEVRAQCQVYDGAWAWFLADIEPIEPFPVRGRLGIYEATNCSKLRIRRKMMTDTYVPKVGQMFDARDRRHRRRKLRGVPFLCTGLIPPNTGLQMILAKNADGLVRQFPHANFVFFPG